MWQVLYISIYMVIDVYIYVFVDKKEISWES